MRPVRRLRKVLLDTPSGTLLPQVERVDYALDRSIRYARRSRAGRRTPNLLAPPAAPAALPAISTHFVSADRGPAFRLEATGPAVRCTNPAAPRARQVSEAARPISEFRAAPALRGKESIERDHRGHGRRDQRRRPRRGGGRRAGRHHAPAARRWRAGVDVAARTAEPGRFARHLRHGPHAQGRARHRDSGAPGRHGRPQRGGCRRATRGASAGGRRAVADRRRAGRIGGKGRSAAVTTAPRRAGRGPLPPGQPPGRAARAASGRPTFAPPSRPSRSPRSARASVPRTSATRASAGRASGARTSAARPSRRTQNERGQTERHERGDQWRARPERAR